MEWILIAAGAIIALIFVIAHYKAKNRMPVPKRGYVIKSSGDMDWEFLESLAGGNFKFRNPKGRYQSMDLDTVKNIGLADEYNFDKIKLK